MKVLTFGLCLYFLVLVARGRNVPSFNTSCILRHVTSVLSSSFISVEVGLLSRRQSSSPQVLRAYGSSSGCSSMVWLPRRSNGTTSSNASTSICFRAIVRRLLRLFHVRTWCPWEVDLTSRGSVTRWQTSHGGEVDCFLIFPEVKVKFPFGCFKRVNYAWCVDWEKVNSFWGHEGSPRRRPPFFL